MKLNIGLDMNKLKVTAMAIGLSTSILAQFNDTILLPLNINQKTSFFTCSSSGYSSSTFISKYKLAETYIPSSTSKNKVIKVNYNIFQKSDGTGNFTLADTFLIAQHFTWLKGFFLNNGTNSDPPNGVIVNDLSSKKIDFVLNGIYFYQDDYMWGDNWDLNGVPNFISYVKNIDSTRFSELNIFFSEGTLPYPNQDARGYTQLPAYYDFDIGIVILRSYTENIGATLYTSAQTTAHEIGHTLGLLHTYLGGGASAICNTADSEYLYDVFGYPSTCPHIVSWSPSSTVSPTDKITNNLMGGNMDMSYLSPKQIGQCHRALYILTTGKYTQCTYDSNHPWMITNNETWDFSFRSFEDIYVGSGKTLDINCTVQMTDSSKLIISNGATVNISSNGKIENRCGCNGNTFEISGTMNVAGILNIPMNTTVNIYSSGTLTVDSLCLNPRVQFNIYSGGKIFIRGIDYTNQLIQYNNQYNVLVNSPSISGNIYAYNQIETQGNVIASGNTLFQAGRKIVLKNGFKAQSKFVARIDTLVNTCEEQMCMSGNGGNLSYRIYNYVPEEKHFSEKENIIQYRLLKKNHTVAPNPANNSVTITLSEKNTTIQKILLKDLTGKTLLQKESNTFSETIDISHLSDGLYFVIVQTIIGTYTEKLIVQH